MPVAGQAPDRIHAGPARIGRHQHLKLGVTLRQIEAGDAGNTILALDVLREERIPVIKSLALAIEHDDGRRALAQARNHLPLPRLGSPVIAEIRPDPAGEWPLRKVVGLRRESSHYHRLVGAGALPEVPRQAPHPVAAGHQPKRRRSRAQHRAPGKDGVEI